MADFVYPTLHNSSATIRLLSVNPELRNGLLDCDLREVTINSDRYLALSYVWGTEPPTYKILLDGRHFWIRPNLWSFLTYARQHLHKNDFWVDALCINQKNVQEKSEQVRMMGSIFSGAKRVLAWVHNHMTSSVAPDLNVRAAELLANAITTGEVNYDRASSEAVAANLLRLIMLPYWSRAWIVQELELASEADILWDYQALSWRKLKAFVEEILLNSTSSHQSDFQIFGLREQLKRHNIDISGLPFASFLNSNPESGDTLAQSGSHQASLFDIVLAYRNQVCTVPYDHAFAFVGLLNGQEKFIVDYAESPMSVFLRVSLTANYAPSITQVETLWEILRDGTQPPYLPVLEECKDENTAPVTGVSSICRVCARHAGGFWKHIAYVPLPGTDLCCLMGSFDTDLGVETRKRKLPYLIPYIPVQSFPSAQLLHADNMVSIPWRNNAFGYDPEGKRVLFPNELEFLRSVISFAKKPLEPAIGLYDFQFYSKHGLYEPGSSYKKCLEYFSESAKVDSETWHLFCRYKLAKDYTTPLWKIVDLGFWKLSVQRNVWEHMFWLTKHDTSRDEVENRIRVFKNTRETRGMTW